VRLGSAATSMIRFTRYRHLFARLQSFYHFTVGGPVEDVRLTTLPAYSLGEAG